MAEAEADKPLDFEELKRARGNARLVSRRAARCASTRDQAEKWLPQGESE